MCKKKFKEFILNDKYLKIYQRIIFGLNVALLAVIAPFSYFWPKTFEGTNLTFLRFNGKSSMNKLLLERDWVRTRT
jgi:hypothetical protein